MIPTNRRAAGPGRVTAALLAGAVALGLVGCSAGQLTQTADQVPAVPGANVTVGVIALRNLQIAYNGPDGYAAGGNAPLIVRIFNDGTKPVRLTGVTAPGTARTVVLTGGATATSSPVPTSAAPSPTATGSASPSASASPSGSASASASASPSPTGAAGGQESFSIEIAPQSYVLLVPGSGPYLQLVGLINELTPGMSADVAFTFDDGSKAEASVPFAPAPSPVRGSPVVPAENKVPGE